MTPLAPVPTGTPAAAKFNVPAPTAQEPVAPPVAGAAPDSAAPPAVPPINVSVTVGGDQKKQWQEFVLIMDDQATEAVNKGFSMAPGKERREYVFNTLFDNMRKTQEPIWNAIEGLQRAGHVKDFRPLWIQNSIVVIGDDEAMTTLSGLGGVAQAAKSAHITGSFSAQGMGISDPDTVADMKGQTLKAGEGKHQGRDWDLNRVGVPTARQLGLTGKGSTSAIVDTGVDATHPALLTNYRGYDGDSGELSAAGSWADPAGDLMKGKASPVPIDEDGHGTWVAFKKNGSDGRSNQGVAPGAEWFAARGLTGEGGTDGSLLSAMQYVAVPTVPKPGTAPGRQRVPALGADTVSHSWGSTDGLSTSYIHALRNMAAMGIVNYFSAGNDGQFGRPGTLGSPASSPYVISVGATDRNDDPTDFSSRGPNPLDPLQGDPSPYVAGPGQDVRGAVPGGGYEREWQGTSMSQPLISGLGDLINEAALKTTGYVFDIRGHKEVLKRIAEDVGPAGPDTGTGYGIPVIKENFLDIVKQVAIDLKLPMKDDKGANVDPPPVNLPDPAKEPDKPTLEPTQPVVQPGKPAEPPVTPAPAPSDNDAGLGQQSLF